jgi:hypothetical protein
MKLIRPPRLEVFSFLFSMPLIAVVFNLILYKERFWTDARIWYISYPLLFLFGVLSWYSHVLYDDAMEKKYPGLKQTGKRLFHKGMVLFLLMSPSVGLIFLCYDLFHILGYVFVWTDLFKGLFIGLCVNLVFETLYEGDYVLMRYKESMEENRSLQQLSLQDEFDTLRNQVNPHFLFNCFNTLSSLITVDKPRAEVFLDELSKVYRYLLRNNQDGLSTVESEVRFIESYYRLLRTRHGEAVVLNTEIDKRYGPYLLPSLTLQLLVENVVKHNVLSKNKPLVIDIFTAAGNKLIVTNNLQRRSQKAPSNKVGLDNIRAKYDLLGQGNIQVMEDDKNFTVVLPLIWSNGNENRNLVNQEPKTN